MFFERVCRVRQKRHRLYSYCIAALCEQLFQLHRRKALTAYAIQRTP